jgi:2-oxoisovalerate dehydrogenase E1 component
MTVQDRVAAVEANLDRAISSASPPSRLLAPGDRLHARTTLTAEAAVALFTDQVRSRALDVAARSLKARGAGFYTISSAGHEANAAVGALMRTTDPAFLHYRSGGFMMARSRQDPQVDPVGDTLLSLVAAADEPIAGGRHKVWGSRPLWVPPQTSTIASHLPKAVGVAFAIERAKRTGVTLPIPADSIVMASFGDASANHASALAGINAARYSHRRGSPIPILFVCEDNGIGISVETPRRWIASTFRDLTHLRYFWAQGELDEVWDTTAEAVAHCRRARAPVFLHLETTRLWGHAGSDVESGYRTAEAIRFGEDRDPLPAAAKRLITLGVATPEQLRDLVERTRAEVRERSEESATRPHLGSRDAVVAPLAPYDADVVRAEAGRSAVEPTSPRNRTLSGLLNAALHDELAARPEMVLFGEDVGRKGGVYYVSAGLQQTFGHQRVFDTLLDETTILGLAQGLGLMGFLPVAEIQYLAYVHNALDQLRGEAASLSFFSSGQFTNPMVVRIAGLAYQKGFGGHFHNDNAIGALRDIPGLVLAVPARGDDAARMLRGAIALAKAHGRVVCFLEPIALYPERDLYEDGDGGWLTDYPAPGDVLLPGEVGVYHLEHTDVLIVTYTNGLRMSLRAARRLEVEHGIRARVVDLRWLNPLPVEAVRAHAAACSGVLVADECRATGAGIADAVIADLAEGGYGGPLRSVRSADTYVPLGPAADAVLLSEDEIHDAALDLARKAP